VQGKRVKDATVTEITIKNDLAAAATADATPTEEKQLKNPCVLCSVLERLKGERSTAIFNDNPFVSPASPVRTTSTSEPAQTRNPTVALMRQPCVQGSCPCRY
jgi:hypothetical protein